MFLGEEMKQYRIALELGGPSAIWTRPDTGDSPVSYPAPTYSAAKGIFESVLWGQAVEVIPERVEICAPIVFHNYQTNYGGPLRKAESVKKDNPYQLLATVLINPCYRLYARVERNDRDSGRFSEPTERWRAKTTCPEHAYQEMFNRRLARGQSFTIPFLGWREFVPDYLGPLRPGTKVMEEINLTLPSMLRMVFPDGIYSSSRYVFDTNVAIRNGVLRYPERSHVG